MLQYQQRSWWATRRAQGALLLALGALLIVVLVGPYPRLKGDLLESPVDDHTAAAAHGTAKAAASSAAATKGGGRVAVGFYGESLCPDCQHMVRDVLQPLFDNGVAELMDLRYIAFGNVKNASGGGYQYQHGPNEGKYNRHILCAQHLHHKQADWFPYVKCLADKMQSLDAEADGCASALGWEAAQISDCSNGAKGKELEDEAAAATWALRPNKNFVPWILVNGIAVGGDFENLERYVCVASPPASRPAACYQLPQGLQHMGRRL